MTTTPLPSNEFPHIVFNLFCGRIVVGGAPLSVPLFTIPAAELDCCWFPDSLLANIPEAAAVKCGKCIPASERRGELPLESLTRRGVIFWLNAVKRYHPPAAADAELFSARILNF